MRDTHGPRGSRLRRRALAPLAAGLLALAGGCVTNPGVDPPPFDLEFPIAAVVSPYDPSSAVGPAFLYVANSNYELAYNTGSLQAYDLNAAHAALTSPECATRDPADCQLLPEGSPSDPASAVTPVFVPGLAVSEVFIGSYTDGIALSPAGDRLYLPVRSDADLTHVDVDPGTGLLSCGPSTQCDSLHTTSDQGQAQSLDLDLPTDPVAVRVGALSELMGPGQAGNYVVTTHRIGAASLFVDLDPAGGSRPLLIDVLENLPPEIVTSTFDPVSQLLWSSSAFYPLISRIGINLDASSTTPEHGALFDGGSLVVSGVDTTTAGVGDTRDVAFDPRAGDDRVYVLSRRPSALFVANRVPDGTRLDLVDMIEVGPGPSRLQVAAFDVGGTERLLAFVSCFDAGDLYVLDPDLGQLLGVATQSSGPFELQVDTVRKLAYVVDFRVSVIRIIDLAPALDCLESPATNDDVRRCGPALLGMIGQPQAPGVLQ